MTIPSQYALFVYFRRYINCPYYFLSSMLNFSSSLLEKYASLGYSKEKRYTIHSC